LAHNLLVSTVVFLSFMYVAPPFKNIGQPFNEYFTETNQQMHGIGKRVENAGKCFLSECEVHLQIQRRGHFQSQSCIGCTTLIWTNNIFYQKNSFVEDSQVLYDCMYLW